MDCLPPVTAPPPSEEENHDPPREITSMTLASISGDLCTVQEDLTSYLKQPNSRLYELDTVLNEAIRNKRSEIVSFLLSAGVTLEKVHCYRAIEAKSVAVYEAFFQNGWEINKQLDIYEPPALAFVIDDWELTQWFLNHNADPNATCYLDYTPMSRAVQIAPIENIQLLFNHGGDIHKGQLLHHAVGRGSEDIIEVLDLLLQKGAQLNERQYERHLPSWNLHFFMGLGTPLHGATRAGNLRVVSYLLQKGADTKIKDSKDFTALDYALRDGSFEITELLKTGERE